MTNKLFWQNSYQVEFDATVTKIIGNSVVLDATCFYPKSGGQVGDTGHLEALRVIDTLPGKNVDIVHLLETKPFFSAGIGFTWIPFYGYETILGLMLRPMLTRYRFRFSHVGVLTQTDFTIGQHLMINICFCGLFINLGDIVSERVIGPTVYIGTVFFYKI